MVPFLENDAVLGDVDSHFKADYLDEETLLKLARAKSYSTAALGKVGPNASSASPGVTETASIRTAARGA